ncbi:DUF4190 domain-containing protein [Streptomyces sp. SID5910]|uniref:DUF4190 domain-containing protein n=1 Tax=Streptomyces sp. SID5910 TaxID=2690312 RepID=UPI00136926ED|nr:DUF4190 domain-containing protein [Streptomyces sp. SID5910]
MSIPPPPGPQGPYHQGPYAPQQPQPVWGGPYGAYPRQAPVNGVAIAAFVLGVLCFVPAVGLVLGLVALRQIRRKGERGKGLAVAGSVLSSVGLALWAVSLSTGAAADFWQGFRDAARGEGTAYALAQGQCFTTPSGSLQGVTYDVDVVPCDQEHDGEVFAAFDLPRGSYPGDDEITRTADDRCYALQDAYAMDRWALPADVDVYYLTPTRQSWRMGDREVTCLFGNTDEQGTLTGSLRSDARTLDPHQHTYLAAEGILNRAMDEVPAAESVEDDFPAYGVWAGQVSEALVRETGMLRAHAWPTGSEREVADLLTDLDAAQKEWNLAAQATDVETYYEHYDKAFGLIEADTTVTARKALGLASTPPDYTEDGGDGGDGTGMEV